MTKIYTGASMSLDGYIAGPQEGGFDRLFAWYGEGEVEIPTRREDMTHRVTPASAEVVRMTMAETGVFVVGRRLFDITNGWDGMHPYGIPVVVVTHSVPEEWPHHADAPFTFVTEGIERASTSRARSRGRRRSASTAARSRASASTCACSTRSGSASSP